MRVKLLYFGEGVQIPSTSLGLGIGLVSVWIDGKGFTTASNDLGAVGYVFLDAPEIDIGEPNQETAAIFADLRGRVVRFEIKPNLFAISGGIARVKMAVDVQTDGGLVERAIEFVADNCKGVSAVSNAISFVAEMFETNRTVAEVADSISEDEMVAIVDAAPDEAQA